MNYRAFLATPLGLIPAAAADTAQAAPPTPAPFSWTGLYIGANLGVIADHSKETGFTPATGQCFYAFGTTCFDRSQTSVGALAGMQIGYNFQSGMWVYGLETDIALSTSKKTESNGSGYLWIAKTGSEAFGSLRGRLGYLFAPNTLIYATGGLAYAKMRNSFRADAGYSFSSPASWQAGWTAGGGVEIALTNRISVKGEGLFYNLGTEDHLSYVGGTNPSGLHDKMTGFLARIGINYNFHH